VPLANAALAAASDEGSATSTPRPYDELRHGPNVGPVELHTNVATSAVGRSVTFRSRRTRPRRSALTSESLAPWHLSPTRRRFPLAASRTTALAPLEEWPTAYGWSTEIKLMHAWSISRLGHHVPAMWCVGRRTQRLSGVKAGFVSTWRLGRGTRGPCSSRATVAARHLSTWFLGWVPTLQLTSYGPPNTER